MQSTNYTTSWLCEYTVLQEKILCWHWDSNPRPSDWRDLAMTSTSAQRLASLPSITLHLLVAKLEWPSRHFSIALPLFSCLSFFSPVAASEVLSLAYKTIYFYPIHFVMKTLSFIFPSEASQSIFLKVLWRTDSRWPRQWTYWPLLFKKEKVLLIENNPTEKVCYYTK